MSQDYTDEEPLEVIRQLWQEHLDSPFPSRLRGKDVNGIDFVVLDAGIAGCVQTFLKRGSLDVFNTATLGLYYRNALYFTPLLYEEGAEYFWRLERLAGLVLGHLITQTFAQEQ